MSEFLAFAGLGFRHIVNSAAADHVLFLLALAAIYRPRDWRDALWVVTAFTVGHSITLALAVTNTLALPTAWVEFLIPVTIVATGIENLLVHDRAHTLWGGRYRPVFSRRHASWPSALRLRVVGVSVAVILVASRWAVERSPW